MAWSRRLRSLRARLLLATALIAVASIGTTAWLTSRGTTDRLREDVEQSQMVDASIYEELLAYADTHPTWDGVEGLVAELAERTGRRIALSTEGGRMIVDSATLDGGDRPPLPRRPAAVVDSLNPVGLVYPGGELATEVMVETSGMEVELGPDEVDELNAETDQISECLDQGGVAYTVETDEIGLTYVDVDWEDPEASAAYDQCTNAVYGEPVEEPVEEGEASTTTTSTGPKPLSDDPAAGVTLDEEEARRMVESDQALKQCLDEGGIANTTFVDDDGIPYTEVVGDDPADAAAYDECAREATYGILYAAPARLYLGTRGRVGLAVLDAGRGPMLAAAGLVALLAVAVTLLVSRRLLRPVVALNDAAQRMAGGELAHRVDVKGDDELADLARSFNSMAEALASNEEQRKRMVNDVAHELRNPLANIRGYVEAALDGVTLADDKLLGSLHEDAVLLQHLVDDLQTLALAESGRLPLRRTAVDVGELAAAVVEAHRPLADASGVELVVDEPEEPIVVGADPVRLRQALGNLVSNALRYTDEGGQVTVRVHHGDARELLVEVEDSGVGIAADDLPHVFDRFWRADKSRTRATGGSGLGLAITRELVAAHDGTIEVASQPGQGSTFTIRLPAVVPA